SKEQLPVFAFQGESGFDRNLPTSLHRALDPADSFRRFVRWTKLVRVVHYLLSEAFAFEDIIDQSQLLRVFKRKGLPRHHQLDRLRLAHNPRQALSSAGPRQDTKVHFGQPDLAGVFARDPQVGCHGDLQSSTDTMPVEGGD